LLEDDSIVLEADEIVALAVKECPLLWRTFASGRTFVSRQISNIVTLSEGGSVVTHHANGIDALTTSAIELTEGKHYWEVEVLYTGASTVPMFIGISRPNLDPRGDYIPSGCTDAWFISTENGALYGNGEYNLDEAGEYTEGDRVGVLLDLDGGSLQFFKNSVRHGPGYAAGSVTGPVVHAVQTYYKTTSVRLLTNAEAPAIAGAC
jgi:hypothetical protein